nr:MAG TPA: hypothetical protein [Bacteriophage sp.]
MFCFIYITVHFCSCQEYSRTFLFFSFSLIYGMLYIESEVKPCLIV